MERSYKHPGAAKQAADAGRTHEISDRADACGVHEISDRADACGVHEISDRADACGVHEISDRAYAGRTHEISDRLIGRFADLLRGHEKSQATVEKYIRDVRTFCAWLGQDRRVDKERVRLYKQYLGDHYRMVSANSMLSALNTFFKYMSWHECCVMIYKVQRAAFRSTEKDLTIGEYRRLLRAANSRTGRGRRGARQLCLIMETLAGTGIRISELPFITVEAAVTRRATVSLKGKTRAILLHKELCRKLRAYCRERGITGGSIFVTRTGRPIDRRNIFHRMKSLAEAACVLRDKIFPHNLRHLFAVTYYEREKDIVRLADLLGHSNVNTTRIYTMVSCEVQLGILDRIGDLLTLPG